ncbi:hypothetical protein [Oceanicoccus sp. KOV_DT_Chl]|uniref:hypothetical protein n=1 Tax=Oceanicoccus sp. KOV_DT_Chl TaxID=1904639 RepID=UPI001F2E6F65|nr:hypothetical protein [Oceanicoccus sp. KOV_DT_Chl]
MNQKSFGIPQVRFDSVYGENEKNMTQDMMAQAQAMLKAAGAINVGVMDSDAHREVLFMKWARREWVTIQKSLYLIVGIRPMM